MINEVDIGATCSVKLVMAQDATVLFRLSSNGDNSYKTTFEVEAIDD